MSAPPGRAGIGVDSRGQPVIDPTENVKALSEAANKRQDDLRAAQDALTNEKIQRLEKLLEIQMQHAKEIRLLESDRLDKIRQVDVLAVNTAADRSLAAIQTLAATTSSNAEQLRQMVANTATTMAAQTQATVSAITERIAALEKSSYVGAGRAGVADPQLAELANKLDRLMTTGNQRTGQLEGVNAAWLVLLGMIGAIATILGIYNLIK